MVPFWIDFGRILGANWMDFGQGREVGNTSHGTVAENARMRIGYIESPKIL